MMPIIATTKAALTPSVQSTTLFVGMIQGTAKPFRIRKVATLDRSAATTTHRLIQKACRPPFGRPAVSCALNPFVTS